jgi:hypothetical protein
MITKISVVETIFIITYFLFYYLTEFEPEIIWLFNTLEWFRHVLIIIVFLFLKETTLNLAETRW